MKSVYALRLSLPTCCHPATWEVSNAVCVVCLNVLCSVIVLYFQKGCCSVILSISIWEARGERNKQCNQWLISLPTGLASSLVRKAVTNHSSALNSVPVQPVKLVKCLVSCTEINSCLSGWGLHVRRNVLLRVPLYWQPVPGEIFTGGSSVQS